MSVLEMRWPYSVYFADRGCGRRSLQSSGGAPCSLIAIFSNLAHATMVAPTAWLLYLTGRGAVASARGPALVKPLL
jgi:hypothetical protein